MATINREASWGWDDDIRDQRGNCNPEIDALLVQMAIEGGVRTEVPSHPEPRRRALLLNLSSDPNGPHQFLELTAKE